MGAGECHSNRTAYPCKQSGMTDRQFWADTLLNENSEAGRSWTSDDDTVILVHENAEALTTAFEYAIAESARRGETLWQWNAINTTRRAYRAALNNVGGSDACMQGVTHE